MNFERLVFDLETDGFLYEGTRVWCFSGYDKDNNITYRYNGDNLEKFLEVLDKYRLLIGHNITGFDIPFIEKIYGKRISLDKCRDTLVMSKLLFPERGSHALEAYGKKFGALKQEHTEWNTFSPEMQSRCDQDVLINVKLYDYLVEKMGKWGWLRSLLLEQEMHYWQAWQEVHGVDIDEERAYSLIDKIDKRVEEIDQELRPLLPKLIKAKGPSVKKVFKKDGTYTKAVEDWFSEVPENG